MRYVGWVVKAVLFLLLLGFAVKNTDLTVVRYYLGIEWRAPLVFVLLVTFRDAQARRRPEAPPPPQGFEEGA
jgi:uncharacterized integral membrane protein